MFAPRTRLGRFKDRLRRASAGLCLGIVALSSRANGPIPGFNAGTPYLVYYGSWNAAQVDYARQNYRLVILDAHSITASQVATLQRGRDNLANTADDVRVLGYISLAEDARPGGPFAGDRLGPRVDPRNSDTDPLSSITDPLGLPSPGGTNYASYYLDTKSSPDGVPDRNSTYGGYFINAGAPAWWPILKGMTIAADGLAGLDEVLTHTVGKALNCDGVFMDTIDTCAPNSFGATTYEWTSPGMQSLIQRIATNYPGKLLMANRGLFFFNPNYKQFAYSIRPYVNLVMFESYFNDSSGATQITPSFPDNQYNWAPKLNAEAGRSDGFNVVALDYDQTPPLPQSVIDQSYQESMGLQGWAHYRSNASLTSAFNTNDAAWWATHAGTQPPQWDSTAAQSATPPPPRVGLQAALPGNQSVTLQWDVARDPTGPVNYNVYYSARAPLEFASATQLARVTPALPANYSRGSGPGSYPYQYTVTGLSNGVTYCFAVRAEDSAAPPHEDTNTVMLTATPGPAGAAGIFRTISIDGNFSDWAGIPWAYQAAPDGNPVNFVNVQFANDSSYLYGHFLLASNALPFSDSNTHLFIDRDNNSQTGYPVAGGLFGSEMMVEGAAGYDQRNGSFNAGQVSALGWALAPAVAGREFEFRLSLSTAYADATPVFGTNTFRLMLQDNRGSEVAIATGLPCLLAAAAPSTYNHVIVDGNFADWTLTPTLATAVSNNATLSFATGSLANDNDYLYARFSLYASASPFSDANTHLFIDTDDNTATGYHASGITIGSEFVVESGTGYDERAGVFAGAALNLLDWALAPAGAGTNFELRVSRLAQYADATPVFASQTIHVILQDNRGSAMVFPAYTFARGGPYEDWRALYFTPVQLANAAISGDGADASGDRIPNLVKYAFLLNPLIVNGSGTTNLPHGLIEAFGGTNYFDVQFAELNPPSGVLYTPQVSTNLLDWDANAANFLQIGSQPGATNSSIVTLRLLNPADTAPRQFVRIAIQRL